MQRLTNLAGAVAFTSTSSIRSIRRKGQKAMAKDSLAAGARKADFGPINVSKEKWDRIFKPSKKKRLSKVK
jgi:hypothetical protein